VGHRQGGPGAAVLRVAHDAGQQGTARRDRGGAVLTRARSLRAAAPNSVCADARSRSGRCRRCLMKPPPALGELRRILGPATGAAVGIGTAVGAGILRTPGEVAAALPSAPWILGVWCLGALIGTLDVFILAEMAASVPRVGGLVAYVRLSFGPAVAFLVGWSMLLVTWPASLAVVAVATGDLLTGGVDAYARKA